MLWLLLACADDSGVSTGPRASLGEGELWTFAQADEDGVVTQLGLALQPEALQGLPTQDTEVVLALPDDLDLAPYDHVAVGWLPAGHDPLGIWDEPHFDVHFFLVSEAERAGIDIDDERVVSEPAAEHVPAGYVLAPGSAVQGQGSHWIDPGSEEWSGGSFTGSLVFGSWDAQWTFIEPMITWASLDAGTALTGEVAWPEAWLETGRYPTTWAVTQGDDAVEVGLQGLQDG